MNISPLIQLFKNFYKYSISNFFNEKIVIILLIF